MALTKRQKLFRNFFFALAIILPFIWLSTSIKPWQSESRIVNLVQDVFFPAQYFWASMKSKIHVTWKRYVYLIDVEQENEVLKKENGELKIQVNEMQEQVKEAERLRELLEFKRYFQKDFVISNVLSIQSWNPFYSIRISKGKNAAFKLGMPVVASNGVAGRIIRVGEFFSDVQLLYDPSFYIDVLIQRTRVRGVLQGQGKEKCLLKINQKSDVKIGDVVMSSGLVGVFPKGLPIGKVVGISFETDHVTQNITVEPWVNETNLEEVMVISHYSEDLEKIVEAGGDEWLEKAVKGQLHGG